MTLKDLIMMPVSMTPDEWQKELNRQERFRRKLRKLCDERYDLLDALAVLCDETDSNRYKTKKERLEKINAEIEKLEHSIKDIG